MSKKCSICKSTVPAGKRQYCSLLCAAIGHNRNRRVKTPRQRKCRRCRSYFNPTRKGHVVCSAASRQAEVREKKLRIGSYPAISALLVKDLRQLGLQNLLPTKTRDEAAAVAREETPRTIHRELDKSGVDPRPARKDDKAVRFPRNPGPSRYDGDSDHVG